jgi:Na+/H+ antiporter NhaD/arsenite permease-like protein
LLSLAFDPKGRAVDVWIAGTVFAVCYVAIATERFDRTLIALLGGLLIVLLGVIDQQTAFAAIDFNVIFLLAGMMVIASALGRTGFFEWLGVRAVHASGAKPFRLLILLAIVTAVMSAFLDNVTTVVLMTPVALVTARRLQVAPYPFLTSQIVASNIGGTATLIGDPPNIMIGSAAGLDFGAFLLNLGPVVIVILVAYLVTLRFVFREGLTVSDDRREALLASPSEQVIRDRKLLIQSLAVLSLTTLGFLFHRALGVEAATVALLGATLLLLISGLDTHEAFRNVEWTTLLFFVGLFILVEGVVQVGIIGTVADALAEAGGDVRLVAIGLVWVSAVASAIVDNIPYTATAIPIVERLVADGLPAEPLWWGLALGACLGGNLTLVGASANVVVANVAARAGYPIRFMEFLRHGAVVVVESLVISSVYLWLRYLL